MKSKKVMQHIKNNTPQFWICLILLVASFGHARAQTAIGVKAGVNFSNVMVKDENGNKETTQSTPGLLLGATVDILISGNFYIQPALLYTDRGFKQKTGGYYGMANNFSVDVSYFQLPVNFLYKPKLGGGKLILGAGPYIGYGTGGTWKSDNPIIIGDIVTDNRGKVIFKNDFKDGEFGNYLYGKPIDYGANFLAGYEFFHKLSIQLDTQTGLANLQSEFSGVKRNGSIRNIGFGFSVGYKL
jgi:hypothetical protein